MVLVPIQVKEPGSSVTVALSVGEFVGQPVAVAIDGPTRTDLTDFKGKSSSWRIDADRLGFLIEGSPLWGKKNERQTVKVLAQAIRGEIGEGVPHKYATEEEDLGGADGFVLLPECGWVEVQITVVPNDEITGGAVAKGQTVSVELTNAAAAELLVSAINKKKGQATASTILALDIRHVSLLSGQAVVDELLKSVPSPGALGFKAIWLVGSTVARCRRLG